MWPETSLKAVNLV